MAVYKHEDYLSNKIVWRFIREIYLHDLDPQSPSIKSITNLINAAIKADNDHCGCLGTLLSLQIDNIEREIHECQSGNE